MSALLPMAPAAGPAVPARRALVVAYCFPPHAAVGTLRTLRLVTQLAADGWSVQILTGAPASYSEGTPIDGELLRSVPANVGIVRAGAARGLTQLSRAARPFKRWLRPDRPVTGGLPGVSTAPGPSRVSVTAWLEQLCAIPDGDAGWFLPAVCRGLLAGWRTKPDVIYSSAPPWTGHLVAYVLTSALGRPWVADFRDPWARGPWRGDRSQLARKAAALFERLAVRRADALLFTTAALRDEVVGHYGPWLGPKCHVVRNGCEPEAFASVAPGPRGECFTLAHVGSLYGGRDPRPLLQAIAATLESGAIERGRFKLRLVGPVALAGRDLAATCDELGLGDVVELVPRLTRAESLAAMMSASALLLLQPGHPLSVPAKFYEYLLASRPILALAEGETAELVRATGTGLVVSPSDEQGIRDALVSLAHGRCAWTPAASSWFDGRLRGREMARVLDAVVQIRQGRVLDRAASVTRLEV